jgi:hypothetical protein
MRKTDRTARKANRPTLEAMGLELYTGCARQRCGPGSLQSRAGRPLAPCLLGF